MNDVKYFFSGLVLGSFIVGIIWLINPMQQISNQYKNILIDSLKTENRLLMLDIEVINDKMAGYDSVKVEFSSKHNKRLDDLNKLNADSLYKLLNKIELK